MRLRARGISLVTTLISISLLTLLIGVAESTLTFMHSLHAVESGRIESRQQLRTALDQLTQDLHQVSYIFAGFNQTLGFFDFSSQPVPEPGTYGSSLIYALPEAPANPAATTYTIVAVWTEPLAPTDPQNPQALQIHMWRQPQVPTPLVGGLSAPPSAINLVSMTSPAAAVNKIYPCYLLPAAPAIKAPFFLSNPALDVQLEFYIQRTIGTGAPPQTEHFVTQVASRS